jgi:hypothetical protein
MAGLLGDVLPYVYSQGDRAKRYLSGLLSDPVGTAQQAAGQFGDNTNRLASLLGQAFSDPKSFQPTNQNALASLVQGLQNGPMGFAPVGIMAGVGAKTANQAALGQAQALEAKGTNPESIWQQTGWGKGPDGKWRFEIDDSGAKLRDYSYTPKEGYQNARWDAVLSTGSADATKAMDPYVGMTKNQLLTEYQRTGNQIVDAAKGGNRDEANRLLQARAGLDQILSAMRDRSSGGANSYLSHGELGKAYPDVYNIHTRIDSDLPSGVLGQYQRANPGQGEQVVLGKRPIWGEDKSVMLHELQHVVQQREGFSSGGSAEAISRDPVSFANPEWVDYAKTLPAYAAKATDAERQEFLRSFVQMRLGSPADAYRNLAGEAEARLVQSRMNMTPAQRAAQFPWAPDYFNEATGVPLNSLIHR